MKLREYLELNEITITRFAKDCKIPEGTMHIYYHGKATPGLVNALIIEKETHGSVSLKEMVVTKED